MQSVVNLELTLGALNLEKNCRSEFYITCFQTQSCLLIIDLAILHDKKKMPLIHLPKLQLRSDYNIIFIYSLDKNGDKGLRKVPCCMNIVQVLQLNCKLSKTASHNISIHTVSSCCFCIILQQCIATITAQYILAKYRSCYWKRAF